ncbi:hypothetical protein F4810DRAFT_709761 [Camillea tinctor]|nr:hypothetical protein F4810DRAFT_709761 [Camillea tinctor]
MAHSPNQESSQSWDINEFFDLEAASLSPEDYSLETLSDQISNSLGLEFLPITGQKQDDFTTWLEGALEDEHRTGGSGPYLSPDSADTWFGDDGTTDDGKNNEPEKPSKTRKRRVRKVRFMSINFGAVILAVKPLWLNMTSHDAIGVQIGHELECL